MNDDSPVPGEMMVSPERVASLLSALPPWLERQRWFAEKGRDITSVRLEDALVEGVGEDLLLLAIIDVAFASGPDARYLLPAAWTSSPVGGDVIAREDSGVGAGVFVEATQRDWFGRWLLDALQDGSAFGDTSWRFTSHTAARHILDGARDAPARVMDAEQSNTSVRFGNAAIVKLVRKLQPGPNPDEELLCALGDAGYDRLPPYLGGASWRAPDGTIWPIALAQAFIANHGDGWTWTLERLRSLSGTNRDCDPGAGSPEWLLGRRTGEMHAAMARMSGPALDPEPVSQADISTDAERIRRSIADTKALLEEHAAALPPSLRDRLPQVFSGLTKSDILTDGLAAEHGAWRIRVHGDYHLGQTLRTEEDDWVIIDFEGEPARPVHERRQKTSAIKDVAGMLRSFSYARGVAERAGGNEGLLRRWETSARQEFLSGYRDAVGHAPLPLVPATDDAFAAALAAWELEKTLYEVAYEVRNRPLWIELPLRSLLPDL